MRLDKLLWKNGLASKKKIKQVFQTNQVTIDGQPAKYLGQNVDPSLQKILMNGKQIHDNSQVYFMLNKPKGYVTAVSDDTNPTVLDLLKPEDQREGIYHIGR